MSLIAVESLEVRSLLTPPFASDDSFTTMHNHPINVNASMGVLMNDMAYGNYDPMTMQYTPPGSLTATLVTSAANGSVSLNSNGSFTYTPTTGFVGLDSFTYEAFDGSATSNPGTVYITVGNTDAFASSDTMTLPHSTPAMTHSSTSIFTLYGDPDGDPVVVTITTSPTKGTVVDNGNGTFTYTANVNQVDADSFTFSVTDSLTGSTAHTGTVNITLENNAPTFDLSTGNFELVEDELCDGDVLGTIVATDPDGDPVTYSSPTNLASFGLTLIQVVLPDGRNAIKVVASDAIKLWEKIIGDPGAVLEFRAFDGWLTAATQIFITTSSSSKGGGGVPPPAWSAIPGYPAALPPAGQVTVIVATRGVHSFIITLDATGKSASWSGKNDGTLKAGAGDFGVYESYEPGKMGFKVVGTYNRGFVEASFTATIAAVNAAAKPYIPLSNNCHCVSSTLLDNAGLPKPTTPFTAPSGPVLGSSPVSGWGKKPDGVP